MLRSFSVFIRNFQARKEIKKTLKKVKEWQKEIDRLPLPHLNEKKILIIRLDDIGDFLLFRNTLDAYSNSSRWRNSRITLLGNIAWKQFFEFADAGKIEDVIWVNKKEYFDNASYRVRLWERLRNEGFQSVICPSRVRPLLLDDMCMKAAAPVTAIAGANDFKWDEWNRASDILYNELYRNEVLCHEIFYNRDFANWCCKTDLRYDCTSFPEPPTIVTLPQKYIIGFTGASVRSRQWPVDNWIDFIKDIQKLENGHCVVLAGGPNDIVFAEQIVKATGCENITGKVNLIEMAAWINGAEATITNDTMAAHLSVALRKPTVMVCSGDNFFKFSTYQDAGIGNVRSVFPPAFIKKWKKKGKRNFRNYTAVTKDIASIEPELVLKALTELL